jgi:hypothetical protein
MNPPAERAATVLVMPETVSTPEVAHAVGHKHNHEPVGRREELIEIGEAVLLAIVAIATAWSGYQTGKWDGHQASLYSLSSKHRVESDTARTRSGQQRLYDTSTFGFWLQAKTAGQEEEARIFERRFRPEYRPAFQAWLRTDPFNNPNAPAGPLLMPQYRNAAEERAEVQARRATAAFEEGTEARERGDKYLRNTVLLATVLFLTALAQKFRVPGVRIGLLVVCGALLVVALVFLGSLPRA